MKNFHSFWNVPSLFPIKTLCVCVCTSYIYFPIVFIPCMGVLELVIITPDITGCKF